jgi:isoleucyl-tRNA synthetase
MLAPLWNVYSFFTIYASIDKWAPTDHAALFWDRIGYLDRWILSRLNEMTVLVTQELNEFEPRRAALLLEDFAEDLTNWYLRRSRRRFWKSENDVDKDLAYSTLYTILIRLTKMLAPFMPFVTEAIYQNLVRTLDTSVPESVHHCSWPVGDDKKIDRQLLLDMEQVRQIVKLGHSARDSAKIKVRQPLAKAIVFGWSEEKQDKFDELVRSELNVKFLILSSNINEFIAYQLVPDLGKLGSRLGEKFPKLQDVLETTDSTELAHTLQSGSMVHVKIDGQEVNLSPDEVSVRMIARDGYSIAVEGNTILVLDIRLTEPLLEEGIARDVVRRIQDLRRQANLDIDERIEVVYSGDQRLVHAIGNFVDYIKQETLSLNLIPGNPESRTLSKAKYQIDGQEIYIGILRRHNN